MENIFYQIIQRRKRNAILVIIGSLLFLKQRHGKQIKSVFVETEMNKKLFKEIKPLVKEYSPTFWLPFSLMKVLYAGQGRVKDLSHFRRVELELQDGEVIALDFYPKTYHKETTPKPLLFFIPGIFGDSRDEYNRNLCKVVQKELGWNLCFYNRRGHGGMPFRVRESNFLGIISILHF